MQFFAILILIASIHGSSYDLNQSPRWNWQNLSIPRRKIAIGITIISVILGCIWLTYRKQINSYSAQTINNVSDNHNLDERLELRHKEWIKSPQCKYNELSHHDREKANNFDNYLIKRLHEISTKINGYDICIKSSIKTAHAGHKRSGPGFLLGTEGHYTNIVDFSQNGTDEHIDNFLELAKEVYFKTNAVIHENEFCIYFNGIVEVLSVHAHCTPIRDLCKQIIYLIQNIKMESL
jgi:hypothetical protein